MCMFLVCFRGLFECFEIALNGPLFNVEKIGEVTENVTKIVLVKEGN